MTEWGDFIEGIATLVWPLLVLLLFLRFSTPIREVIESARSRRFTVKVGGQELTMDEVTEQQSDLIADLQSQLAALSKAISGEYFQPEAPATISVVTGVPRVLWVDDSPKNNSFLIQQIRNKGIDVDLALSTDEGLQLINSRQLSVIISDMGREEGGVYKQFAGLELLRVVRDMDIDIPYALFTTSRSAQSFRQEAEDLGADVITSSATTLIAFLQSNLPEWTS